MAADARSRRIGIDVLALAAAAGVCVGAFAPAVEVSVHGEISLASIAEAQALGVAAAAASTLLVIVPKRYGWLWIVSLAVWAVLAWPIIENQMQPDRDPISDALRNVTDPMEAGGALGDHALRFVDLRWGGFALLGGVLLLTWTAWIALRRPKQA